jgi:hypothetical protein
MPLRRIFAMLLLPLLPAIFPGGPGAAQTRPAQPRTLTLEQYMAETDRLSSAVKSLNSKQPDISEMLRQTPSPWQVQTEQQTFRISSEWFRRELIHWRDHPDENAQSLIIKRLENLRSEAAAFAAEAPDSSANRARLNTILAAKEFSNIHGPTWLDGMKQRLGAFLLRWLGRTFASSVIPTIGDVAVYGLITLAVLLLAYWMYRVIRNSGELETILSFPLPVSSKEWTLWMAEARAAAERGNWRDAIHLAYWCGVSFLEAQGLWRPDSARTPREYLQLLPSSSEHQPALVALTRSFEVVWYGKQEADADTFSRTLAQLEKLGCR